MFGKLKKSISETVSKSIDSIDFTQAKSAAVNKIADVDYNAMTEHIDNVPSKYDENKKEAKKLMTVLDEASRQFKGSTSENKEDEFINYVSDRVNLEQTVLIIEPVMEFVPGGTIIMFGLNYIVKKRKKRG